MSRRHIKLLYLFNYKKWKTNDNIKNNRGDLSTVHTLKG